MRRTLLLALLLLVAPACDKEPTHAEIRDEIERARVCVDGPDCINLGAKCPFGCAITVNRREAERIRALLNGFESSCALDCAAVTTVLCEKGLCTPR